MEMIKYKYDIETGNNYCEIKFELTSERLVTPDDYHRIMDIIIYEIKKLETIKQ
jgi:hypothetical protein